MRNKKSYSQQFRNEIIHRYKQSGLSKYHFCQLPDVPVSERTLSRWLQISVESTTPVNKAVKTQSPHVDLNIACYSLSNNVERFVNGEEALTLEEMIKFQRDVHDCCLHLYQMSCSKKNISLLSQMMEVL